MELRMLKEKGNHLPLWDEVEIIDREEHRKIKCLKKSAHMFLVFLYNANDFETDLFLP